MLITKEEIRRINKLRRAEMAELEVKEKSLRAAEVFLSSEFYKNAGQIMLYTPLGKETDTNDIIKSAFAMGKKLVFPVTDAATGEITPYYATENTVFTKGAFSVSEPVDTQPADMSETDVILVPGIAFDKSGVRVGFGKGCYDRLLKDTEAVKIGFCYDFQLSEKIASQEHDVPMDFVITENGLTECNNGLNSL
ncbi:MAG: 5-formyltetrahydrofolate cyclo-ligase [Clostridia bacterium]|nr:5-formyltetrahydrofolate cyclo-ligase [Clostridia bacterium]